MPVLVRPGRSMWPAIVLKSSKPLAQKKIDRNEKRRDIYSYKGYVWLKDFKAILEKRKRRK